MSPSAPRTFRKKDVDFRKFQDAVGTWADRTFPRSTDRAKLKHLRKELAELTKTPCAEEAADCLLILLHLAHAHGWSLYDAAIEKFEVVKKRRWGKPDADGVVHHIRDGRNRR